jgi:hypothetical protein
MTKRLITVNECMNCGNTYDITKMQKIDAWRNICKECIDIIDSERIAESMASRRLDYLEDWSD